MKRVQKLADHLLPSNTAQETKRIIKLGPTDKTLDSDVGTLPNLCSLPSADSIRDAFWSVGYGLFRDVIPRSDVLKARHTILSAVDEEHGIISDVKQGILKQGVTAKDLPFLEGKNPITDHLDIRSVLEHESIHKVMRTLLQCDTVTTFDYKWLRLVAPGQNTGVHVDNVYMNRGTSNVLTCWIPLMDITMEMGTVFVLDGSYHLPSFTVFQECYGSMDAEKSGLDGTGHFTQNPDEMMPFFENEEDYKMRWKSVDFKAGDILIFTLRTVHMSSVNQNEENRLRMSCDTRWLNAEEQADARFMWNEEAKCMGNPHSKRLKFGLHNTDEKGTEINENQQNLHRVTIQQLRRKWGI